MRLSFKALEVTITWRGDNQISLPISLPNIKIISFKIILFFKLIILLLSLCSALGLITYKPCLNSQLSIFLF